MTILSEVQFSDAQRQLISLFLEQTGYGEGDILALNFNTRLFMTRNGGRYQLQNTSSSLQVKWLAGPPVDPEYRL